MARAVRLGTMSYKTTAVIFGLFVIHTTLVSASVDLEEVPSDNAVNTKRDPKSKLSIYWFRLRTCHVFNGVPKIQPESENLRF